MRIHAFVLALGIATACPALSDIVNITFMQELGISGSVLVRCDTCPGGAGMSSNVVPISSTPTSVSGIVSFTDPSTGRMAAVTDQITQNNSSTSGSFDVGVIEDITISGVGAEWSANGSDADQFTVSFALTTESSLDLSNTTDGTVAAISLMDSMGNVVFSSPNGAFDTSILLAPGTYTLAGHDVFNASGFPMGFTTSEKFEADFNLSADFTAVPEPAATWFLSIPFLVCAAVVASRRKLAL